MLSTRISILEVGNPHLSPQIALKKFNLGYVLLFARRNHITGLCYQLSHLAIWNSSSFPQVLTAYYFGFILSQLRRVIFWPSPSGTFGKKIWMISKNIPTQHSFMLQNAKKYTYAIKTNPKIFLSPHMRNRLWHKYEGMPFITPIRTFDLVVEINKSSFAQLHAYVSFAICQYKISHLIKNQIQLLEYRNIQPPVANESRYLALYTFS